MLASACLPYDGLDELGIYEHGMEDVDLADALLVEGFETTSLKAFVECMELAIQLLCTQS